MCERTRKYENFSLYGMVHHYGNVDCGHYTAEIKIWGTNDWYECDDNNIKAITRPSFDSTTSYLLFFVREGSHASFEKSGFD